MRDGSPKKDLLHTHSMPTYVYYLNIYPSKYIPVKCLKKRTEAKSWVVMVHVFDLCTQKAETGSEWTTPRFRVSSRTARATQRNPVWKNKKQPNKQTKKEFEARCGGIHLQFPHGEDRDKLSSVG